MGWRSQAMEVSMFYNISGDWALALLTIIFGGSKDISHNFIGGKTLLVNNTC
jgi:hypothetical protein